MGLPSIGNAVNTITKGPARFMEMQDIYGKNAKRFIAAAIRDGWHITNEGSWHFLCRDKIRVGVMTASMAPTLEIINTLDNYRNGAYAP